MSDLLEQLAALNIQGADPATDATVAADLARGQAARTSRRRRRMLIAGGASTGLVALGAVGYVTLSDSGSRQPQAALSSSRPTTSISPPKSTVALTPSITLVAYRGQQLPGYSISRIPAGYVLQGISAAALDIAKKGDRTPLDDFVGKIVVTLSDTPGPNTGQAVSVNGRAGRIARDATGVTLLTYSDGKHNVVVQAWNTIRISSAQLVAFAEGVTVLDSAQVSHG